MSLETLEKIIAAFGVPAVARCWMNIWLY
nr:hypothetical protein [Paenibacillus stellifer]